MKLKFKPTRRIATGDLFMAADPPLYFEVNIHLGAEWSRLLKNWEQAGKDDVSMACEILGRAFVSVEQDGEVWALGSKEKIEEMREAIEESSPGSGDTFIIDLLLGFSFNHYNFLADTSMAYGKPSRRSENGASPDKLNSATAQKEPSRRQRAKSSS